MLDVIVDVGLYRNGRRGHCPTDLSDALAQARGAGDAFVWIGLFEPTAEEFDEISTEFGLHPLAVEDALKAHQRPKLDRYGDSSFMVLNTLALDASRPHVSLGEVMIFLGDSFVVTVRHGKANPLAEVRQRLEESAKILAHGPAAVLHAVCDAVVDSYLDVAATLQDVVDDVETKVFEPRQPQLTERIYACKRQVVRFRRVVLPLIEPMRRLASGEEPRVDKAIRPFFSDVKDHVLRVAEHVESMDRLLGDVLSAHLALVGVRQNDDMRKISAWAAMAAVPTMIAGIYGMNFHHMPALRQVWGYPAALGLMVVICLVLHRVFRRSGWL